MVFVKTLKTLAGVRFWLNPKPKPNHMCAQRAYMSHRMNMLHVYNNELNRYAC